jgi:hypothetical protein
MIGNAGYPAIAAAERIVAAVMQPSEILRHGLWAAHYSTSAPPLLKWTCRYCGLRVLRGSSY